MNESNTNATPAPETSLGQDVLGLLKHWLGGRRGLLVLGLLAAAGGLWLGWPTLAAAGLAPLVLLLLPCAAMCALGLCMKGGQSADSKSGNTGGAGASARQLQSSDRKETDA